MLINQLKQADAAQLAVGYMREGDCGPVIREHGYVSSVTSVLACVEALDLLRHRK